ncbi:hypothetical protein DRP04_03970, partial [Archaeoglobales archaeon]
MGSRVVYVRVGARKEEIEIDGNTTAEDVIRAVGGDPETYVLIVNGNSLCRKDKVLPLLAEGENDVRILPKAKVGHSSYFLTGDARLRQEETLLREIGFLPAGKNRFTGLVKVGKRVIEMDAVLPSTFPYARPIILIHDYSFLGKHPCIMQRDYGIEVHFHDEDWKPWMHAVDLVVLAADFLER